MTGDKIDFSQIFQLVQNIQANMSKITEDLKNKRFVGETGGGLVKVTVNGLFEVVSIELDDELIKEQDKEMMEDLIKAAVNRAMDEAKAGTPQGIIPDISSLFPGGMPFGGGIPEDEGDS